jgi:starch-binding outer membrane protein, SusD/RagB family
LAVGTDSVVNLARVLQGRAQLELGNYAAAADDVALVPTTFQYRVTIHASTMSGNNGGQRGTVADREGGNGLPFLSSGDPRTTTTVTCSAPGDYCPLVSLTMPAKYFDPSILTSAGYAPFVVASGIEAQLIRAEAALQRGDVQGWTSTLNTLRASAGTTLTPAIGVIPPLPADSTTAASAALRVSVLFHERAFWLFLTGHRQGDLRRLIRQYGTKSPQFQSDQHVYPAGLYNAPGTGRYGSDVTVPIPTTEYANPNYHGCIDRSA